MNKPIEAPLELFVPNPWQTRHTPHNGEYIATLAADIAQRGLLQIPVGRVVDKDGQPMELATVDLDHLGSKTVDHFGLLIQLAFGHGRLEAFHHLATGQPLPELEDQGQPLRMFDAELYGTMPVILRTLTDEQMATFAWSENEKRLAHSPLDRAHSIQAMLSSFGWTHKQAGIHLGISRSAVSNALRLLELPDELQGEIQDGSLSGRQATALIPLYTLPEELREQADRGWHDYYKPEAIVELARTGGSSDEIRGRVSTMIELNAKSLEDFIFPTTFEFSTTGVQAAICDQCELKIQRGGEILCPDLACYKRKKAAWVAAYLESATQESGIPTIQDEVAPVRFFAHKDLAPTILDSACEHLRLVYDISAARRNKHTTLEHLGHPEAEFVCTREGRQCLCLQALEAGLEIGAIEDLEELQAASQATKRKKRERLKLIRQTAADQLLQAIDEGQLGAMQILASAVDHYLGEAMINQDKTPRQIWEAIALQMIPDPYNPELNADKLLGDINRKFNRADLPSVSLDGNGDPEDLAAVQLRKLQRITRWMETLKNEIPKLEAVEGNIINLEEIEAVIQESQLEEDIHKIDQSWSDGALARSISCLEEIAWILSTAKGQDNEGAQIWGWSSKGFKNVAWLALTPTSDVKFRSNLESAPVHVVAYALALAEWRPEHNKTRIKTLAARLRRLERELEPEIIEED